MQGPGRNGKAIEESRDDSKSKDLLSRLRARSHSINYSKYIGLQNGQQNQHRIQAHENIAVSCGSY
jgi:hypothetical protein